MAWFWLLLLVPILAAIGHALSANSLQNKFVSLGQLTGKTRAEIENVVGAPNAISAAAGGRTLLQWQTTGYHIALLFNGDECLREAVTQAYRGLFQVSAHLIRLLSPRLVNQQDAAVPEHHESIGNAARSYREWRIAIDCTGDRARLALIQDRPMPHPPSP